MEGGQLPTRRDPPDRGRTPECAEPREDLPLAGAGTTFVHEFIDQRRLWGRAEGSALLQDHPRRLHADPPTHLVAGGFVPKDRDRRPVGSERGVPVQDRIVIVPERFEHRGAHLD